MLVRYEDTEEYADAQRRRSSIISPGVGGGLEKGDQVPRAVENVNVDAESEKTKE